MDIVRVTVVRGTGEGEGGLSCHFFFASVSRAALWIVGQWGSRRLEGEHQLAQPSPKVFLAALAALYLTFVFVVVVIIADYHFKISTQRVTFET